jgi:hypothetical protein
MNAFPGQRKQYAASVHYFSNKHTRGLLKEYIHDYNLYTFEPDPDWDQENIELHQRRASNALKTLLVLFRDLPMFSSPRAAKEYLRQNYQEKCQRPGCFYAVMQGEAEWKCKGGEY